MNNRSFFNCNGIKGLFISFILLLCSASAGAHDFSAENDDGVTIYYSIINSKDRTYAVAYLYYNSYNNILYNSDMSICSDPEAVSPLENRSTPSIIDFT